MAFGDTGSGGWRDDGSEKMLIFTQGAAKRSWDPTLRGRCGARCIPKAPRGAERGAVADAECATRGGRDTAPVPPGGGSTAELEAAEGKRKTRLSAKPARDLVTREAAKDPGEAGAVSPRAGRRTDKLREKTGKNPTRSAEVSVSFADLY